MSVCQVVPAPVSTVSLSFCCVVIAAAAAEVAAAATGVVECNDSVDAAESSSDCS